MVYIIDAQNYYVIYRYMRLGLLRFRLRVRRLRCGHGRGYRMRLCGYNLLLLCVMLCGYLQRFQYEIKPFFRQGR